MRLRSGNEFDFAVGRRDADEASPAASPTPSASENSQDSSTGATVGSPVTRRSSSAMEDDRDGSDSMDIDPPETDNTPPNPPQPQTTQDQQHQVTLTGAQFSSQLANNIEYPQMPSSPAPPQNQGPYTNGSMDVNGSLAEPRPRGSLGSPDGAWLQPHTRRQSSFGINETSTSTSIPNGSSIPNGLNSEEASIPNIPNGYHPNGISIPNGAVAQPSTSQPGRQQQSSPVRQSRFMEHFENTPFDITVLNPTPGLGSTTRTAVGNLNTQFVHENPALQYSSLPEEGSWSAPVPHTPYLAPSSQPATEADQPEPDWSSTNSSAEASDEDARPTRPPTSSSVEASDEDERPTRPPAFAEVSGKSTRRLNRARKRNRDAADGAEDIPLEKHGVNKRRRRKDKDDDEPTAGGATGAGGLGMV